MHTKRNSILCACAAAFAVMVGGPVAVASAETGWYIAGTKFSGEESIKVASTGPVTLTSTIGSTKLVVQCEALNGTSPKISNNKETSWGLALSGCKAKEPSTCHVSPGVESHTLHGGLEENGLNKIDMAKSETESLFTDAVEGCALEGEYEVKGAPRCKLSSPNSESVVKLCELPATSQLKLGASAATLTGTVAMELTGANKGKSWTGRITSATPAPEQWYIGGSVFTGEESLKVASTGTATLRTSVGGVEFNLQCKALTGGSAKIFASDKDSSELVFTGCAYIAPSGCKAPSTLATGSLSGTLESEGAGMYDKLGSEGGGLLSYELVGCAWEGEYSFTGTPRCEIASKLVESVVKQCEFNATSGSKIKFGANAVTFTATVDMELAGPNKGEPWTAMPS